MIPSRLTYKLLVLLGVAALSFGVVAGTAANVQAQPLPGGAAVPAAAETVTVYGTSWCPACEAARAYFTQRGVPFVWRDLERDPVARREATERARSIGANPDSVPLLDVGGTVISGFNATAVAQALRQRGLYPSGSAAPEAAGPSATIFLRGGCDRECRRMEAALRTRGMSVTERILGADGDAEAELQ